MTTTYGPLIMQVSIAAFIVLLAMGVDLASGLYKAGLRGEIRSSWGLKRSVQKFILYEGALLIAGGMDVMLFTSRLLPLVGLTAIHGVAVISSLITLLLCVVEIWSLREKADEKTRKDLSRTTSAITAALKDTAITNALIVAFTNAIKEHSLKQIPEHEKTKL